MSKKRYEIRIAPPNWAGYKYSFFYDKRYGDYSGGATEFKSKEELLTEVRRIFRRWEGMDGILHRLGDKVTPRNLLFESFTSEIVKTELFGNLSLDTFLS